MLARKMAMMVEGVPPVNASLVWEPTMGALLIKPMDLVIMFDAKAAEIDLI